MTADWRIVIEYDPAEHDYDLAQDPRCLWGWEPAAHYPGGHGCIREYGHAGRCKCDCDVRKQRPLGWDERGRADANR